MGHVRPIYATDLCQPNFTHLYEALCLEILTLTNCCIRTNLFARVIVTRFGSYLSKHTTNAHTHTHTHIQTHMHKVSGWGDFCRVDIQTYISHINTHTLTFVYMYIKKGRKRFMKWRCQVCHLQFSLSLSSFRALTYHLFNFTELESRKTFLCCPGALYRNCDQEKLIKLTYQCPREKRIMIFVIVNWILIASFVKLSL